MRNALRLVVPVALVSSLFAAGPARSEDAAKIPMVLKLEKGAAADYKQHVTSTTDIAMAQGMAMNSSNEVHRAWSVKVTAVEEGGGGTVDAKFGRIHGSSTSMMGATEFDSEKADAAPDPGNPMAAMGAGMTKAFTALAGKTATAKIAKDGKIGEVTGLDGVADAAGGGNPFAKGLAQANSSPSAVKGCLQGCFIKVPEKPVGVGDTWTDEVKQDAMGGMKITVALTFKVTAMDADTTTVGVEGKMTADPAEPAPAGGAGRGGRGGMGDMMKGIVLEKGDMKGTCKVSRKDGMVILLDSQVDMLMKGADGTPSAGSSVTMSTKNRIERVVAAATPTPATPATPPATK